MIDPVDYDRPPGRQPNAGFSTGLVGGIIMVIIHILLLIIFRMTNQGDVLAMLLALFVYFMIGRAAAEKQFAIHQQSASLQPSQGIANAGLGAALITSIITWIYIILRGVFRDFIGITILVDPVGLFCAILIDVLLAMGLGYAGGKTIQKRYQIGMNDDRYGG